MTNFIYKADLSGLTVLKTNYEQYEYFFYKGHPNFLIPDFNSEPIDIWIGYLDYLEKIHGEEVEDDGGEVSSHKVIDNETGLTRCTYTAYGICTDGDVCKDHTLYIEGYVVVKSEDAKLRFYDDSYFIATLVEIK